MNLLKTTSTTNQQKFKLYTVLTFESFNPNLNNKGEAINEYSNWN